MDDVQRDNVKKTMGNVSQGSWHTVAIQSDSRCARVVWLTVRSVNAGACMQVSYGKEATTRFIFFCYRYIQYSTVQKRRAIRTTRLRGDPR